MKTYIAPLGARLGDFIVSLPIIQAHIRGVGNTHLITRSKLQESLDERISGLAGSIPESEFDRHNLAPGDLYINLRDHPVQTDYLWGSEQYFQKFGDAQINELLTIICRDKGIACDFTQLEPLSFTPQEATTGKIIFVPGTSGIYKCWPTPYWLKLFGLLQEQNLDVLVMGQPQESEATAALIAAGLPWIASPTTAAALDLISSCRAVVAVDTGLMHLAVHQGIPCICLFRDRPIFARHYPHNRCLIAPACPEKCAKHFNWNMDICTPHLSGFAPDPHSCQLGDNGCMSEITPEAVWNSLSDVLVQCKSMPDTKFCSVAG